MISQNAFPRDLRAANHKTIEKSAVFVNDDTVNCLVVELLSGGQLNCSTMHHSTVVNSGFYNQSLTGCIEKRVPALRQGQLIAHVTELQAIKTRLL